MIRHILFYPITKCSKIERHCKYHTLRDECVIAGERIEKMKICPDFEIVKINQEEVTLELTAS